MEKSYPIIAKEGWLFLAIAFFASALLTYIQNPLSWIAWTVTLFILQFFRDPLRNKPSKKNVILSAADGKVIAIEKMTNPYTNKSSVKVSVFMNVFNVHSNKCPVDEKILEKYYYPGKFLNASLSKASLENERCAITIQTKEKKIITCVQIAGLIARRILCYKDKGDEVKAGERYGFIKFGSRADIFLPLGFKPNVKLKQKTKAGVTVIGKLR